MLKSIHKPTHLRNFAGQTLGVDAYGWLHRGTVACAIELAQGKPTQKYVDFAMNRVRMLIHFGVKPYLVFDGDYLPSKAETERDRAARRKESKRVGLELIKAGKISQAHLELQKAVDVTPFMARELIEELKAAGVPYVVAPYEADSQLTYLEQQGHIQGVLSEDSDLLVFGVRCLLTKLDQYGECVMIRRNDFTSCREVSLVGWKQQEFRMMAMLSGCDYLPGIDKMGLKTAYRHVRKYKAVDRIVRTVQFDGKMKVPSGYLDAFIQAERTFLYQWVFCPDSRQLVNLNNVPADISLEDMPYIGKADDPDIACGVATGDLDPNTKEPIKVFSRPFLPARKTGVLQTPNEKQGKPISEFFKPRRTPLAELDPNAFTPSPSQRNLLASQQGASWSASQAPAMRPPAVSRTASMPAPHSAPQPVRRTTSAQVPGPNRFSPKRQRLCSDSALAAHMNGSVGLEGATSRFFAGSPSVRKASKKDEFELWSDDSAAEAVAALADTPVQPSPKKRRRLEVFTDPPETAGQVQSATQEVSQDTSQETNASFVTDASLGAAEHDTPATSFESIQDAPSIFSKGIAANFDRMRSKWTYQSGGRSADSRQSARRTESAPFDTVFRDKSPTDQTPTAKASLAPSTVLEDIVPASSPPAERPEQDVGIADEEPALRDREWLEMEQQEVEPETLPKGSEDFLVPESPRSERSASRPSINLGRFAFAG